MEQASRGWGPSVPNDLSYLVINGLGRNSTTLSAHILRLEAVLRRFFLLQKDNIEGTFRGLNP